MDSDFTGGRKSRQKSKFIHPTDGSKKPSIHELADNDSHDSGRAYDGAGPEADAAEDFVAEHSKAKETDSSSSDDREALDNLDITNTAKNKSKNKHGLAWLKLELTKKQKIIALACAVVLIVVSGVSVYALSTRQDNRIPVVHSASVVKKVYYSPLSGVAVSKKRSHLPVTGVMIENSLPARPQSSLSQAGVVFEAIAEGGITRFLALFQSNEPSNIGPVRSARPYFLKWALGYDAAYAHVGGSAEALQDIKIWQAKDLDQFYAPNYYHRVSSRYAPHNMYTSMKKLHTLEKSRHWFKPSKFTGFERKADSHGKKVTASTISMNPSGPDFAVKYTYSKKADAYKRYLAGKPHIDAGNNKQIEPKVAIALIIPYGHESDGYHSYYNNLGSGAAYIFQDGGVIKGRWQKKSKSGPLRLLSASGKDIKLNRGQTWITALSSTSQLKYGA